MKLSTSRLQSTLAYSILATVVLAGGILAFFAIGRPGVRIEGLVAFLTFIAGLLAIGALWGLGIAVLNRLNPRAFMIAGARYWSVPAFIFALILEGVNAFQSDLSQALNVSRHFIFTISFVLSVLVVTTIAARGLARALGKDPVARKTGTNSGVAAALAFLLVDVAMLTQGWELGKWKGGQSIMITVMFAGLLGAALVGGATMGWALEGNQETITELESEAEQPA